MKKNPYTWLLFFLGLYAASVLLQSIINQLLGFQLFLLDKKYWLVFFTGAFYTACNLCSALVFYTMLEFQKLANYSRPLLLLTLGISALYGLSLILLRAKGNRWLKATGAFMLVIGLIFLSAIIRYIAFFRLLFFPILGELELSKDKRVVAAV